MKGRSPLWWKSGRFLAGMWTIGTLLVAGSFLPFLYEQWVEAKGLTARYQSMSRYIETHRETLDSSGLSDPPTPDALSILVDKVPPEREVPRLLLQLQDAADAADVKVNAIHIADSPEELDRLGEKRKEGDKEESGSKEVSPPTERSPGPPAIPHVEPVWIDAYLTADIPQLKEWFQQLDQLTRIVSVQEWEHGLKSQPGYGNSRTRILAYMYRDPELEGLPEMSQPEISRKTGDPIRVRPKKEEKDDRSSRS